MCNIFCLKHALSINFLNHVIETINHEQRECCGLKLLLFTTMIRNIGKIFLLLLFTMLMIIGIRFLLFTMLRNIGIIFLLLLAMLGIRYLLLFTMLMIIGIRFLLLTMLMNIGKRFLLFFTMLRNIGIIFLLLLSTVLRTKALVLCNVNEYRNNISLVYIIVILSFLFLTFY